MSALSIALLLLLSLSVALAAEPKTFTCECSPGTAGCTKNKTCISDEKCVVVSAVNIIGELPFKPLVYQACKNSTDTFPICNEGFIFMTAGKNFSLASNSTCCTEPMCNQKYAVPKEDTSIGKKVCPTCFKIASNSCEPVLSNCAKSQDKCINVTGTLSIGTMEWGFAGRGCATSTADFLNKNHQLMFQSVSYNITTFSIADAHDGASQTQGSAVLAVLPSLLLAFLLTRCLY